MNQSMNEIIFVFPYVKQSSKYIQQESLHSDPDINQSFIFVCLSSLPIPSPHQGFLALSLEQEVEVAGLHLREHSFKGKLANRQEK